MSQQSNKAVAFVTSLSPEPEVQEPVDNTPSDSQPPGCDDDDDIPQSLEEALVG